MADSPLKANSSSETALSSQSDLAKVISTAIEAHKSRPGALLPILHHIQDELAYIPDQAVPPIAKALNLSRAEVHGVVSFYHYFSSAPQGEHVLEVCRAESCQAKGGRELEARALAQLGIGWGETTRDQKVTLKPVYCLGNCACSPSIRVGKSVYGRVSTSKLDSVIEELRTDVVTLVGGAN